MIEETNRREVPTAAIRLAGPQDSSCKFRTGALIISLDLELRWGVRDLPLDSYRERLLGTRDAARRMLDMFDKYGIAATWATVGLLFAESRDEMREFIPPRLPSYENRVLDPYLEEVGLDEKDDPIHFAPDLIREIQSRSQQEIGSHTFSHFYCLEPGQTVEHFTADLGSAVGIAARRGIRIRSVVLPRNQIRADYLKAMPALGVSSYRGVKSGWFDEAVGYKAQRSYVRRFGRLMDSCSNITGHNLIDWPEPKACERGEPLNVPASRYLRPYTPQLGWMSGLQVHRICQDLRLAGQERKVYHLWWHPEDFGLYTTENLALLRKILEQFRRVRDQTGFRSLTMSDYSATAADQP